MIPTQFTRRDLLQAESRAVVAAVAATGSGQAPAQPAGGRIDSLGAGNLARAVWALTVYGCNADDPDGDYATRSRTWRFHQDFLRGITHFLRTDPAAPADQKAKAESHGFEPGISDDTGGWPHQMYVREDPRMKAGNRCL